MKTRNVVLIIFLLSISTIAFSQKNNTPKVLAIFPTTDSIPVNILRFYIQFSKPMQEMEILKHIKLTDQNGKNITGVFYENQYELWNENRTEVTLIVDPGRVKLGLLANNEMGRAFNEGKNYALTIDSLMLDFNDEKLSRSYTKKFTAVAEDRQPPDTKNLNFSLPKANTRQSIYINFLDKIDHISAKTLIKIFKGNNEIKGNITLENEEQHLLFTPINKWQKGNYKILINKRLEDIAANSLNQVFDHKPTDYSKNTAENVEIKFEVK